eukprot:jgi/Picsp_1/97/NSC_00097-R1_---NA---
MEDAYTVRGLLSRLRAEENRRVKEIGKLTFEVQKLTKRCQKAEAMAKLADDKRKFKDGEALHLKAALARRDEIVIQLEKQIEELERDHVPLERLQTAELREQEADSKLMEKESLIFHLKTRLKQAKKEIEDTRREVMVVKSKYEELLESENKLQEENRYLYNQVHKMTVAHEEYDKLLFSNVANKDRRQGLRALMKMGQELDVQTRNFIGDANSDYFSHSSSTSSSSEALSL